MARGTLHIYLGAAPGVGKTVAMCAEAQRRQARGTDVVVGLVETHGRAFTQSQLEGLEVAPRRTVTHRGAMFDELDVDAVLERAPQVVLVDELAHTNAPGSRHVKRWEDIEELLDAGIDVVSTVNIQHLESLNDVVQAVTGVRQRETVPDDVVRSAEQVELVDMSPEGLRRRMAHGNIYPPERIDTALANYFRPGNLSALRELALLWLADRVDEALERYRLSHGIVDRWPTRERVVVAVSGAAGTDVVLRRAAQIASRGAGTELLVCHVTRDDGLGDLDADALAAQRTLAASLGGTWHEVAGDDIGEAVIDFARGANATQIVVGTSRRSRSPWTSFWSNGIGEQVAAAAGDVDVHLVGVADGEGHPRRHSRATLSPRRRAAGWLLATLGIVALTVVLAPGQGTDQLPIEVLLYLALTVLCALVGGMLPALVCAVVSSLVINWFFTPPLGTLTIADTQNAAALVVFVLVAAAVSSVVNLAARRSEQAVEAQRSSRVLASLAQSLLAEAEPVGALLDQARSTFGMRAAALVSRPSVRDPWRVVASSGDLDVSDVSDAAVRTPVDHETTLVLVGPVLPADEQHLVAAFTSHAAALLARERLVAEASQARALARDNEARTTLLAAVSHDLRTPLAGIKAAVSSLRQTDVRFSPDDEAELLESIEESADRLTTLIGNLLDMSRLQTGTITPHADELSIEDVVDAARQGLAEGDRVRTRFESAVPSVVADAGLLDRVFANVLDNALRHSPGRREVVVQAGRLGDRLQVRVVDRGHGVPEDRKERIFEPFQRGGDAPRGDGLGLGLAVARGLTEAMHGSLWAEDTPGGGLTIALELPVARA